MYKFAFLFLLSVVGFSPQNAGTGWHLESNQNGIAVYLKQDPDNSVNDVKAVCTLNTSLSGLVALIVDVSMYHKWIYHCDHAIVLKTISPLELIYYQETSVPWPASDRDFIGRLKLNQDPTTKIITATVENLPGYIPEKAGVVRLQKFGETMTIVPKGPDQTELSYEMTMDVGGNIPGWMVNMAVSSGPYQSLSAMQALVNTGAYTGVHYPYIKNY